MERNNGSYSVEDITSLEGTDGEIFDELSQSDFGLFRLIGENSPYEKKLIMPLSEMFIGPADKGVTTDYFQYIVLIKNSKATEPLKSQ